MADAGVKYTNKEIKKLDKEIAKIYKEAQVDLQAKLDSFTRKFEVKNEKYLNQLSEGIITDDDYQSWLSGQVFQGKQWQNKVDAVTETMYNSNRIATSIINGQTMNIFAYNGNYQAYQLEHGAGVNFGFNLYNEASVSRLIKDNPQILPKWKINEKKDYIWNQKKVNNAITQGIIQGERLDQITKRISTGLCAQNENLMKTFARTGMTEAQNAGRYYRLLEAKEKGIDVVAEWMATLDAHTRDTHKHLDGEQVEVGKEFSNGCKYPGDPQGPPKEVYNCRCTLVSDIKDFPSEYKRYDNIDGKPIRNMTYDEWDKIKRAEQTTGIKTDLPTPAEFKRSFDVAKATNSPAAKWRVDDTHTIQDYVHDKLFKLSGGSVVAIAPDGNIISVCKNMNGDDRGSELLKVAVANGGDRLDAFGEGLYQFYTKNGFEPVSWTPFNEEYAPHDWVKGRDNAEPVIFYRYTGKTTNTLYEDFIKNTPSSLEYDDAMAIRDKLIDSKK